MGIEQIQNSLNITIKRIKEKYHPIKIILFGSYARNEADEYSDVDILVVSNNFQKEDLFERALKLHGLVYDLDPDINIIGATNRDLIEDKYPTIRNAIKNGINLI